MKTIVLNKKQLKLLKQEALNGKPDKNGIIVNVDYIRTDEESEILEKMKDDAEKLVKEYGMEKELEEDFFYDIFDWYYTKYLEQKKR